MDWSITLGGLLACYLLYDAIQSEIHEAKDEVLKEIQAYRAQIGILEDELAQARAFYEAKEEAEKA